MATNFFKVAYDKIILIIETKYPRFAEKNRIFVRDYFKKGDFGHEDTIKLYPLADYNNDVPAAQWTRITFPLQTIIADNENSKVDLSNTSAII